MTDLGTDISTFPDLDVTFTPISGARVIGEAAARRLLTPRGSLFYDPTYGYDLRALLNAKLSQSQLPLVAAEIEREIEKDERVLAAAVVLTLNTTTQVLTVQVGLTTAAGPFRFVLDIGATSYSYQQLAA